MAYRRIHSKGEMRIEEKRAASEITPGMLIEVIAAGTVQPHSEIGGQGEVLFALEDALQGRGVATVYDADDLVTFGLPVKGAEVCALIAAGEAADEGDELVSGGDGTLINATSLDSAALKDQVIAVAAETFTTLAANTLERVRAK